MKAVASIAIALSLAGSLLAGAAYWRVRSAKPGTAGDSAAVESLQARVAQLEADLARSRAQIAQLEGNRPSGDSSDHAHPASGPPSNELEMLRKRIESLERQMAGGRPGQVDMRNARPNPQLVEAQKKRLTDASLPEKARATSLMQLRMQGAHKTDDIVDAALALLGQAVEPNTRALIVRNLQGANNPRMVPALLGVLKADADEDVRDETAKTLGDYLDKPEVKTALEAAATGDASEKVRRRAQATLAAKK